MRDELFAYYERELTYLRQMGADFAGRYPKVASRLLLEPGQCEDPHVERLIEAVALLAARVHLRLDDDFPEITQAILNIVYPHYTRPTPSMSVVQFTTRDDLTAPFHVPAGATLYSRLVDGSPCTFRTCYDTGIWPFRITEVQWTTVDRLETPVRAPGAAAALRVRLDCVPNALFTGFAMDVLRLYLDGDPRVVHTLYELLSNNCVSILLRDPDPKSRRRPVPLIPSALSPVGFGDKDSVLPHPGHAFTPYRTLQEYFAFAEKFLFFDLHGMSALAGGEFESSAEIVFIISPFERADRHEVLEVGVGNRTVRQGCTPIVNLFPHKAEPIQLDQARYEYPLVADYRHARSIEVFSVDEVKCTYETTGETVMFQPFFSFQHGSGRKGATFWQATRRPATSGEQVSELWLTLVDLSGRPVSLDLDTLLVHCTCSNGNLPSRLPFGNEQGDFDLEGGSAVDRIVALRKPTASVQPPLGREAMWRLISHFALNYLSLVETGTDALKEMLRLYYRSSRPHLEHQIDGIVSVESRRRFARVGGEHGVSYVRGMRVELELNEENFAGEGVYLFASVLEHFLSQYVSMNSFSQLAVRTPQRKEALREWPPRAGNRILL